MHFFIAFFYLLLTGNLLFAQDTIYTRTAEIKDVRIRDNQPLFIEYREDNFTKDNIFVNKKDLIAIACKEGYHEAYRPGNGDSVLTTYYFVRPKGDTTFIDPNYSPVAKLLIDTTIKLCRFSNDKEYARFYGDRNHFYANDPERLYLNAEKVVFEGVDFSCMKLVNAHEISKGAMIKNKYLDLLCDRLNSNLFYSTAMYASGKKVSDDVTFSQKSYEKLDENSWVCADNYVLHPGKIPAIIRTKNFVKTTGLGVIFLIERFDKQNHSASGYWVAFNFADRKVLLIDYIISFSVGSGSGGYSWESFWQTGLIELGVYNSTSFEKYLDLEKKGKLVLDCSK